MKQLTKINLFFVVLAILSLASCVKDEITSLKLNKSTISLNVGQTDSLVLTVTLTGDINAQPISWIAGNKDVVSITESAIKTATSAGTANSLTKTIIIKGLKSGTSTVTLQAGEKTASCLVTVGQRNFSFYQALTTNYGDFYETGNNNFDMYLFEPTLSLNDTGALVGTGTYLYIDFYVPITQNTVNAASFTASGTGAVNTFFPGIVSDNNIIGTHIVTFYKDSAIAYLIKDGQYSITPQAENFLIEGDLITESNEVIHFSYRGSFPVEDKREVPVEISPLLTKGELFYLGDAYETKLSNNFVVYLATEGANVKDSVLNGEILMLELNTSLLVKDYIPNGTYNMIRQLNVAADLAPTTLIFGYSNNDGDRWGCWYFGKTTKKLSKGNIVVSKLGNQYSIEYSLFDRVGSKIYGTYNGPLTYIDKTIPPPTQVSAAARVRRPLTTKSFSDMQVRNNKIKNIKNIVSKR